MTYNQLIKELEAKVATYDMEEYAVKWLFLNSDFFVGYGSLEEEVDNEIKDKLTNLVNRYINEKIPPQYLLHKAFFFGFEFYVDEGCFIPRYETEQLVEEVIYRIDDMFKDKHIKIADICSGSGAIGITLKKEIKNSEVSLYELSDEALTISNRNAKTNKADVNIYKSDFINKILEDKESFDVIVCNPPYIKNDEQLDSIVVDHEPNMALFGGKDGLDFYRIIFKEFANILNSNGFMAFEFGYDQKDGLTKLIKEYLPNKRYEFLKDYNNKDRMLFIYES